MGSTSTKAAQRTLVILTSGFVNVDILRLFSPDVFNAVWKHLWQNILIVVPFYDTKTEK